MCQMVLRSNISKGCWWLSSNVPADLQCSMTQTFKCLFIELNRHRKTSLASNVFIFLQDVLIFEKSDLQYFFYSFIAKLLNCWLFRHKIGVRNSIQLRGAFVATGNGNWGLGMEASVTRNQDLGMGIVSQG